MKPFLLRQRILLSIACFAAAASPAAGQLRIVNFNVAQLGGNMTSMQAVFAALNNDDKPGFAMAPHLYIFQEVRTTNTGPLLNMLNAAAPPGVSYVQGTYTNFNENGTAGAQAMYYRPDVLVENPAGHVDIFTQAGRYSDRWQLRLVGYDAPDAMFYIYSTHLKASTGSTNEQTRLTGAIAIRNNADALPPGSHIIIGGDFNVYHNNEPAYQRFIMPGVAQALDPLGTGSWASDSNAIKHTQSPCRNGCTLVAGGMDDRFDFQLSTAAFHDGAGLSIMPGTYRSFGNDGNHYDTDINAGNNSYYPSDIPRSNALANHLKVASDHVPVVAEYQIPAVLAANMPEDFGRVIEGAEFAVELAVSNAANVVVPTGADLLHYQVTSSGFLSGTDSGFIPPLAPPTLVSLPVDTAVVGAAVAGVQVTSSSQAVQGSPATMNITGRIVRTSQPSFDADTIITNKQLSMTLSANTGAHTIDVEIYNRGFDENQALLDVDTLDGLAAPLAMPGSLPNQIGATPATLSFSFDTTGLETGTYTHELTLQTSDEDLPGETADTLYLAIQVVVPGANADVNCDGLINLDDVIALVEVLLGLETSECPLGRADFDQSGTTDGQDIALFVQAFLQP